MAGSATEDPPCVGCDEDKQPDPAHADWMETLKRHGIHGSQRGEHGYGEVAADG